MNLFSLFSIQEYSQSKEAKVMGYIMIWLSMINLSYFKRATDEISSFVISTTIICSEIVNIQ